MLVRLLSSPELEVAVTESGDETVLLLVGLDEDGRCDGCSEGRAVIPLLAFLKRR